MSNYDFDEGDQPTRHSHRHQHRVKGSFGTGLLGGLGGGIGCVFGVFLGIVLLVVGLIWFVRHTLDRAEMIRKSGSETEAIEKVPGKTAKKTPANAGQWMIVEPIAIRVDNVSIDPVDASTRYMRVTISIKNRSETKKIDYYGFDDFTDRGKATDEFGNDYHHYARGIFEKPGDSRIDPGETIIDVLQFEKPIAKAKTITIDLPGKAFGVRENFAFTFPAPKD